jgi:hypothetical protein
MARALKGTLTLCLALGLTSIAWGQGFDPKSAALGVLANPDVQKELNLSKEQVDKLKDSLGKVVDKYKDDLAKLLQLSPEEQQKKLKAVGEESQKAISGVLDAKQWKRYKQISWQLSSFAALQDPDLQKELKLSDDQKKKLEGVFNDFNKKMQEMIKNGERSPDKYQAAGKEAETKAMDVLSEDQRKSFKELKGAPFEFARPKGGG